MFGRTRAIKAAHGMSRFVDPPVRARRLGRGLCSCADPNLLRLHHLLVLRGVGAWLLGLAPVDERRCPGVVEGPRRTNSPCSRGCIRGKGHAHDCLLVVPSAGKHPRSRPTATTQYPVAGRTLGKRHAPLVIPTSGYSRVQAEGIGPNRQWAARPGWGPDRNLLRRLVGMTGFEPVTP